MIDNNFKGTPGEWSVWKGFVLSESNETVCMVEDNLKSECDLNLMAAAPDLLKSLQEALPLVKVAFETCRVERIRCGHQDIRGINQDGQVIIGLWQEEIDQLDNIQKAISKALYGKEENSVS